MGFGAYYTLSLSLSCSPLVSLPLIPFPSYLSLSVYSPPPSSSPLSELSIAFSYSSRPLREITCLSGYDALPLDYTFSLAVHQDIIGEAGAGGQANAPASTLLFRRLLCDPCRKDTFAWLISPKWGSAFRETDSDSKLSTRTYTRTNIQIFINVDSRCVCVCRRLVA